MGLEDNQKGKNVIDFERRRLEMERDKLIQEYRNLLGDQDTLGAIGVKKWENILPVEEIGVKSLKQEIKTLEEKIDELKKHSK